ncbi:MAG: hypothetical protein Q8941_20535 [Bacteroidota bacterium]|nr:hypothetical protein [Bacteroidota bacterium]
MGLDNLNNLIDSLERFDAHEELRVIVENNTDAIAELQKQQMADGVDSDGNDTQLKDNGAWNFGYRPFTIKQKEKYGSGLGAVTDRVTGYMTGELYDKLAVKMTGDEFAQTSGVQYFSDLLSRTGGQWMGLNLQSRIYFGEEVTLPQFAKVLEEKTGLVL